MASTINISLPEPLKRYVDAQTEAGEFATPGEYIRELIEEDLERRSQKLEECLLKALEDEKKAFEIPAEILEHGDIVGFLQEKAKQLR